MTSRLLITLLILIATIATSPLMKGHPLFSTPFMNMVAVKVVGIAILAMSHALSVPLHPFLAPPAVPFLAHLKRFRLWLVVVMAMGHILAMYGYVPGYPVLSNTSLVSAFIVPYAIFTAYLLLLSVLIHNGWSKQWANLAFLGVLLVADTQPWHPNPLVIVMSIQANGFKWVYTIHLLAIVAAVITMKTIVSLGVIQRLTVALNGFSTRCAKSPKK